jgi:RNA polymerase sigma-70 factor (ECF subfamily)
MSSVNQGSNRDASETVELLRRAEGGDRRVLDDLFSRHRHRLRRMALLRMSASLRARLDASDVVQEAYVEACRRLPDYLETRPMPFFLWLRYLTGQTLLALHRRHAGTKARDPRREVPIHGGAMPEATSEALAAQLLGKLSTPSKVVGRAELRARVQEALAGLDPPEREILALRHFEQLSNAEAAAELGIKEAAASKRYVRALIRLRGILAGMKITLSSPDVAGP